MIRAGISNGWTAVLIFSVSGLSAYAEKDKDQDFFSDFVELAGLLALKTALDKAVKDQVQRP
jgi:hypothetical protein